MLDLCDGDIVKISVYALYPSVAFRENLGTQAGHWRDRP